MSKSVDCVDVVNLVKSMKMDEFYPKEYSAISNNCCTATPNPSSNFNIECNSLKRVTLIDISMSYNGLMNGNLNFTALPKQLEVLYLGRNAFKGPIELQSIPNSVYLLELSDNQFDSIVGEFKSGSRLKYIQFGNNKIVGKLNVTYPSSLVYFSASNNYMYGSIPPFTLNLKEVDFSLNLFSGSLDLVGQMTLFKINNNLIDGLSSPVVLTGNCNISNNPLGKNNNSKFTNCGKTNLYTISHSTKLVTYTASSILTIEALPVATTSLSSNLHLVSPMTSITTESQWNSHHSILASSSILGDTMFPGTTTTDLHSEDLFPIVVSAVETQSTSDYATEYSDASLLYTKQIDPILTKLQSTSSIRKSTGYNTKLRRLQTSLANTIQNSLFSTSNALFTSFVASTMSTTSTTSNTSTTKDQVTPNLSNSENMDTNITLYILVGIFALIVIVLVVFGQLYNSKSFSKRLGRRHSMATISTTYTRRATTIKE